jgi:predicted deacylase
MSGVQSRIVDIPAGVDAGTILPISELRGERPGPTLALIAGNHGYEYPPILALQRFPGLIRPAEIAGTILMVHVANMPSFLGRTVYFSPVDGKNLNRVYPGNPNGTVSERIAYAITNQVIDKADYVLDLHCGDGNEWLRPYVYQAVTGEPKMDAAIARLVLAFGIDHVVVDRNRPTDPAKSLYCSTTAITRGKPAVTIESGALGMTDSQSVDRVLTGILGVLRELGMTESGPMPLTRATYLDPTAVIASPETGMIIPKVDRDQTVAAGELIAVITDFFGQPIAEVHSPIAGVVLYIVTTPPMTKGQPVACVGTPGSTVL